MNQKEAAFWEAADLRTLTDAQLRQEWLAFKEDASEGAQVDGDVSVAVARWLAMLKHEMERRGLCLN